MAENNPPRGNLAARQDVARQNDPRQNFAREYDDAQHVAGNPTMAANSYMPAHNTTPFWIGGVFPSDATPDMRSAMLPAVPIARWGNTYQSHPGQGDQDGRHYGNTSSSAHPPQSTSHPPPHDELDRMERLAALQERQLAIEEARLAQEEKKLAIEERKLAFQAEKQALNGPSGSSYGRLTMNGDSRAVRGNVISGRVVKARIHLRRHTFDDADIGGNARLVEGTLQIDNIGNMWNDAHEIIREGDEMSHESDGTAYKDDTTDEDNDTEMYRSRHD